MLCGFYRQNWKLIHNRKGFFWDWGYSYSIDPELQFTKEMRGKGHCGSDIELIQHIVKPSFEDWCIQGCDTMLFVSGSWHFKESIFRVKQTKKNFFTDCTTVFETVETPHQVAQRHIPEDLNPQWHGCEDFKFCKSGFVNGQAQLSSTIPVSAFKLILKVVKKCSECYRVKNYLFHYHCLPFCILGRVHELALHPVWYTGIHSHHCVFFISMLQNWILLMHSIYLAFLFILCMFLC